MRSSIVPVYLLAVGISACHWAGEKTKDALNKGGEFAGSAATEVIEGVATGVEETWSVDVRLSDELSNRGLAIGRTEVESDSAGRANRLVIYFSTTSAFNDTLTATAYDQGGVEMGRTQLPLHLQAGSADYYAVLFQSRTDLERKSRVEIK